MNAQLFLQQQEKAVKAHMQLVDKQLASLPLELLNLKPATDSWSILECLEHLNRYSRYYNTKLSEALSKAPENSTIQDFNYSWLGKKSIDQVSPKNIKKQKTLKHMNPNNSFLSINVVSEFLNHQTKLLALITEATTKNITKKAIPVEFFKLLKISVGDTFSFLLEHQDRHLQQALRVKQVTQQLAA